MAVPLLTISNKLYLSNRVNKKGNVAIGKIKTAVSGEKRLKLI
jgi:hypothetical protein